MSDPTVSAYSKSGFSELDVENIKKAAAFVLANFYSGTGTEVMLEAHARWPNFPERVWSTVLIAVDVALAYHLDQEILAIENEQL